VPPSGYSARVAEANGIANRPGDGWAPERWGSESQYFMEQPLEYLEARLPGGALGGGPLGRLILCCVA
jgi:hypothetical protein